MDTVTTPPVAVKPGYKTTEFWLTFAATVVGLALASDVIPTDGPWAKGIGLVSAVLSSMGYAVGRAKVKGA